MAVYFKHCHNTEVGRWGVIGLPKNQSASTFLGRYQPRELVLLAGTKMEAGEFGGKVFGLCTLVNIDASRTAELINPDIPDVDYRRWPQCIPVLKMWRTLPAIDYDPIAGGALARRAREKLGQRFALEHDEEAALSDWIGSAERASEEVYHSPRVREYLDLRRSSNT